MAAAEILAEERAAKLGRGFWFGWVLGMTAAVVGMFAVGGYVAFNVRSSWGTGAVMAGFTVLIWLVSMIPWYVKRRRGARDKIRGPQKRYLLRFMPAMLGYVVLLVFAVSWYNEHAPEGAIAWAIALAPVVPLVFAIRAVFLLWKEEDDEFQRARIVESYMVATALTLIACTAWGFLAMFGRVPHVDLWAAFPVWAVGMGIGQIVARRRDW